MNTSAGNTLKETFRFGTKAETLSVLRPLVRSAVIDKVYYFAQKEWQAARPKICVAIKDQFESNRFIVVRSSAIGEDGHEFSMAGAFHSCLDVDCHNQKKLCEAIDKVLASYPKNPLNQVLIQPMVKNIAVSGVIMTRDLQDGAPYYVVNFDDNSGRTDSITGGKGAHKTV